MAADDQTATRFALNREPPAIDTLATASLLADLEATFSVGGEATEALARPHTLKSDDTFAIFDVHGNMRGGAEGLYHRDTRYLSRLAVAFGQGRVSLLGSAVSTDNALLSSAHAGPAPCCADDVGDEGHEILLERKTLVWGAARYDTLTLTNWSRGDQRIALMIDFGADFADLFEIRGARRARHGKILPPEVDQSQVLLGCMGLDCVQRSTLLCFHPEPQLLDGARAVYMLDIDPGASQTISFSVHCRTGANHLQRADCTPDAGFSHASRAARGRLRDLRRHCATIVTGNALADATLRRCRDDLIMLATKTPQGFLPYAGVPWFSAPFGRDSIITALQVLWYAPGLARGVLRFLAANQATATDPASDAEPGKILHEARDGEMAGTGEVPFRRYYGSVDATPLFVMLAGAYLDRTNDRAFAAEIWPHVAAAMHWLEQYGDADGDGFVEYGRKSKDGLVNQGWKDSRDSIFHADGSLAHGPIALCEVQAYVFAANEAAARLCWALGRPAEAERYMAAAARLRDAFDHAFWDDALGCYVLALDGAKRPCRVLASNAGHALFAGIARPDRAERITSLLMGRAFFSGWGIRTLARGQPRYNPSSYHNGSVWPHDNALIGLGFARYGNHAAAARLFDALLDAASWDPRLRLPELFCGIRRTPGVAPTAYPVACVPQAWSAAALPALLQAGLPELPAAFDTVTIRNIEVGKQERKHFFFEKKMQKTFAT